MTESQVFNFLNEYGLLFMFIIVFMEYLNLPGFPSGIIMPAVGAWITKTDISFLLALGVSVVAGTLGSLILYYVGKHGGRPLLEKLYNKYPKTSQKLKDIEKAMINNGYKTVFISKLIPVVRTMVGFPAGVVNMNIFKYISSSILGIIIWNAGLMISGVTLGKIVL